MRIVVALALASLGQAGSTAEDVYETFLADKLIGTETATRASGEKDGRLVSRVELTVDGTALVFAQEATLDAAGRRIVAYSCDITAPNGPMRVRATPGEGGWKLDVGESATKTFPADASTIVLDNNLPSHFDLLCRDLVAAGSTEASYTTLVPQVLSSVPLLAQRDAAGRGSLGGTPVETVSYRLDVANLLIELACRKGDGALLAASVPVQSVRYRRKGYEPAGASSAGAGAPDPREKSVVVKGPAGDLAATLTVPASAKPVPGVLMLSGSGPNDRDETIGPNKPFRDLARGLADRGVATLRFDKRTVTVKDVSKASTIRDEYVVDGLEALALLRRASGVDPSRLFVLGHSLGTLAAPVVAKDAKDVRGLILLAGPARPPDALLHDQITFQMRVAGQDAAEIESEAAQVARAFERLRSDPSDSTAILGAPATYWRDLLRLDLPTLLAESTLPALVIQGEKDVQVSKTLDFDVLRTKLGEGNGRFAYRSYPNLNHLLIPVTGEATGKEYGIAGTVDRAVSEEIAGWISRH
jgi:pimeloyl-ACP methyl ester carboxylesterase